MGVWDRDYSKARPGEQAGGTDWASYLPPRGSLILIVLHLFAFFMVLVLRHDEGDQALSMFFLRGESLNPVAILLHPFGVISLLTLIFVIYAIWVLGGRIESRFGAARLCYSYVLGTLLAGIVFLGFAQLSPAHSEYELAMPAGALAAWTLGAWRGLNDEMVSVFGKLMTTAKAVAIGAAIVAGLVFFRAGPSATGWLIAAAAGSLAWPALNLFLGGSTHRAAASTAMTYRFPARSNKPSSSDVLTDREIDEILAKISRNGIDSISEEDRQRLEDARKAKLRRSR